MQKEEKKIKIFVSHRIDIDSQTVENSFFENIRCGAVYDKRQNIDIIGDNTGDNISEKRLYFNELTVLYWMWKNVKSDYYGLCHYRRYFNFENDHIESPHSDVGILDSMADVNLNLLGLMDEKLIRKEIESCDMIVPLMYELSGSVSIVDYWLSDVPNYIDSFGFDLLFRTVKDKFPMYYESLIELAKGNEFQGYNCFIMTRDLMNDMCEFIFGILFEIEEEVLEHIKDTNITKERMLAYMAEWLFTSYTCYIKKNKKAKVCYKQLVGFANTEKENVLLPEYKENNIPIVLKCLPGNDYPRISVLLQGILENCTSKNNYDIIILKESEGMINEWGNHIFKEAKKNLASMCEKFQNVSLRFFDPKDNIMDLETRSFFDPFSEELYYEHMLPWILKEYDKAIFLNGVLVINEDIAQLMQYDLGSNCIAATKDMYFSAFYLGAIKGFKKEVNKLNLKTPTNYIDSCVMVYDLINCRNKMDQKKIVALIQTHRPQHNIINSKEPPYEYKNKKSSKKEKEKKILPPNDIFNIITQGKTKFLPLTWNCYSILNPEFFFTPYNNSVYQFIPKELYEEFKKCEKPMIHNLRSLNPAVQLPIEVNAVKKLFLYARQTPFLDEILFQKVFSISHHSYSPPQPPAKVKLGRLLPLGSLRRNIVKFFIPRRLKNIPQLDVTKATYSFADLEDK